MELPALELLINVKSLQMVCRPMKASLDELPRHIAPTFLHVKILHLILGPSFQRVSLKAAFQKDKLSRRKKSQATFCERVTDMYKTECYRQKSFGNDVISSCVRPVVPLADCLICVSHPFKTTESSVSSFG